MKKYISILLSILMFFSLTACESNKIEPDNTINTAEETSKIQQIVETKESSSNDKTEFELTDKSYDDLTSEEKEQLKYYNDGYTFIGNVLDDKNEKWFLYKYGELFKVIDISSFVDNEKPTYEEYHLNHNDIRNYVVIGNSLYFFISETKDVYRINFDDLKIQKYIDGEEFEEYTVYNNSVMLKHNNNLLFICTCKDWNNVLEVDTTKGNPNLNYKGKSDTILEPGDDWYEFNFIPLDKDNYRITQCGYDIVDSLSSYYSYNFSLNDYKITDIRQFPEIEFDEEHWQNYVEEDSLGYFYRDNKDILFSYVRTESINNISGRSEWSSSILKSDSDKNKNFLSEDLPYFYSDSNSDGFSYKCYTLNNSKLSNDWFYFFADGHDLIYFFDDNILCDINDCSVKYIDLWNVYYEESIGNYALDYSLIYSSKAITDFKNNLYQGEEV